MSVDQALKRPSNYAQLPPRRQWGIDANLGILDWTPTKDERDEYTKRWLSAQADKPFPEEQ